MVIDLIFNILNLLLVIIVIVYVFYKYLLKNILKAFKDDKANVNFLLDQNEDLTIFEEKLDQSILEQNALVQNLALKIEKWNIAVDIEKDIKMAEYGKCYAQIEKRLKIQHDNYQNQSVQEEIAPELLNHLELELYNYFENKDNIDNYFDNIFKNKLKFKDHE